MKIPSFFQRVLALFMSGLAAAHAAPDQTAQQSIASHNPMRPLAISDNSDWLLYGNGTNTLHLVATKTNHETHRLVLPASPTDLALSRSGTRAVVTTDCRGMGVVEISATGMEMHWINEPHNGCTANLDIFSFDYRPVAISPDGETMAAYGNINGKWQVGTYRIKDHALLATYPLAERGSVQHLEFLPGNRFLLIVESEFSEDRRLDNAWITLFSLWDLESMQLHNQAEVFSAQEPTPNALMSLSHFSGEGWAIQRATRRDAYEMVRFPMRACNTVANAPQVLDLGKIDTASAEPKWSADSFGRWLAVGRYVKSVSGNKYAVDIFDVSGTTPVAPGKPIARLFPSGEISQMRASRDGTTLWATRLDGRLERLDIPREALTLKTTRAENAKGLCPLPDEVPDARLIDNTAPTHSARQRYEFPVDRERMIQACQGSPWRIVQTVQADPKNPSYPFLSCDPLLRAQGKDKLLPPVPALDYRSGLSHYHSLTVWQQSIPGPNKRWDSTVFRKMASGEVPDEEGNLQADSSAESSGKAAKAVKKSKQAKPLITDDYRATRILNNHLVLGIKHDSADVYDFKSRKWIATLDEPELSRYISPLWQEETGILWVIGKDDVLQGWQIEERRP